MEKEIYQKAFTLKAKEDFVKVSKHVITEGRFIIGRAESCDIIIEHLSVNAIHGVIELTSSGVSIFDMNSTFGIWVNDDRKVIAKLNIGDRIKIGEVVLELQAYDLEELPPLIKKSLPPLPHLASDISPKKQFKTLSLNKEADLSEYIFEDGDDIYPVFKYEFDKQALEVMILHNDRVFSIDYIPERKGEYYLTGNAKRKNHLEFPILEKKEKKAFLQVDKNSYLLKPILGFEMWHLDSQGSYHQVKNPLQLRQEEIVQYKKGYLEVLIRKIESPPVVAAAPLFRRDKEFKTILLWALALVLIPLIGLQLFTVDPELEKEKAPERIATILYRKKQLSNQRREGSDIKTKTVDTQKNIQKTEDQRSEKPVPNPGEQVLTTQEVKKGDPNQEKVVRAGSKKSSSSKKSYTPTPSPHRGRVESFNSTNNFKTRLNSILSKGGTLKGVKSGLNAGVGKTGPSIGSDVGEIRTATTSTSGVGSLTGSTEGSLGHSKGAEGLASKTGVFTASFPGDTVIYLGNMDPRAIDRAIRKHRSQFSYCYDQEKSRGGAAQARAKMTFVIGASGHITRASVSGPYTSQMKSCVVRVLKGIQFPVPRGGGQVEATKSLHFAPNRG